MAPTNAELASAVQDVLAACRHFRGLYSAATAEQKAIVMAGWPWPKSVLELRDMTAWVNTTVPDLLKRDPTGAVVACAVVTLELLAG